MTLKYFVLLVIFKFEEIFQKFPSLNEIIYYTKNPGKLDSILVKLSSTFKHEIIKRSDIILELSQLYPEMIDRFLQNRLLSYKTNANGKKQALFRLNEESPNERSIIVELKKQSFIEKLSEEQKELIEKIKEIANSTNKLVIIESTNSGINFKVKDGEPNAYLVFFAFDNFNQNELVFNYRDRQVKLLPFNKIIVNKRNFSEIIIVLQKILSVYSNEDFNSILKDRIKKNDRFDEYETDTNGLLSHQKAGSMLADRYDRFAFFYDTGTGKTIMALEIMKRKYNKFGTKFLAIVPKPIIKTAWMDDSLKFFPRMKILPLSKNIKPIDYVRLYNRWNLIDNSDKYVKITEEMELGLNKINKTTLDTIMKDLKRRAHHYIINMDLFRDKEDSEILLEELKFSGLILDESALIKNYESKSARRMRVIAKNDKVTNFYLLSGKPAPNNDSEYYSQMKIVDPETFSMSRDNFIQEFFFVNKYNKVTPKESKTNELAKMVANRSLVISKEDCLDLPETTNVVNNVQLSDETLKRYSSMYKNFVTEVETIIKLEKKVQVNSVLASLMKLRQIANGFILDENHKPYQIHDKKTSRLEEIMSDIGPSQVVIWHNFDFELEMIDVVLKKLNKTYVTANGKTKNLDENIKAFKDGKVDVIVANLKTLKYGVTLINSHYAIYYSMSYSFEDYYQSQARIHRLGQKNECTYFFILSEDTIDQNIYQAVIGKESRAKFFEGLLKDAVKFGVDYNRIKNLISKQNNQNNEFSSLEEG